ncbi:hypothetical protein niasHT_020382 [Heterodera trifolii]|uniref:Uncharacterized protein n=1 Tax=Heterodera trifolii TaxID=157864 RepID=A0ABD2JX86_9BILA
MAQQNQPQFTAPPPAPIYPYGYAPHYGYMPPMGYQPVPNAPPPSFVPQQQEAVPQAPPQGNPTVQATAAQAIPQNSASVPPAIAAPTQQVQQNNNGQGVVPPAGRQAQDMRQSGSRSQHGPAPYAFRRKGKFGVAKPVNFGPPPAPIPRVSEVLLQLVTEFTNFTTEYTRNFNAFATSFSRDFNNYAAEFAQFSAWIQENAHQFGGNDTSSQGAKGKEDKEEEEEEEEEENEANDA